MKMFEVLFVAGVMAVSIYLIFRNIRSAKVGELPPEHEKFNGRFAGMNSVFFQTAISVVALIFGIVIIVATLKFS